MSNLCNNGIDDDYDGYIDCDDSDCMYDLNCYSGGTTGGTTEILVPVMTHVSMPMTVSAMTGPVNWDGDYNYYCSPGTDCFDCSTGGTTGSTTGGSGLSTIAVMEWTMITMDI